MDKISVQPILAVKVSITIGTMLNVDGGFDGHATCKQTFIVHGLLAVKGSQISKIIYEWGNFLKGGTTVFDHAKEYLHVTQAWWRRGNMFTSHRYDLGSILTPGCMWDVFHPSQPMPGGFPLGFSSTFRRAWNCSDWNHLLRPTGLARDCSGWRKINGFTFYPYFCL